MLKSEFLELLKGELYGLPEEDVRGHVEFYSEMIDDRIEEGLSEEDAVAAIGPIEDIVSQIIAEIPLLSVVKERIMPKSALAAWQVALTVLLSPIIFSLAVAAASVAVSLYAALWSAMIALWVTFAALVVAAPAAIVSGLIMTFVNGVPGVVLMCAGLVSAGLAIFAFFGCKEATRLTVVMTKRITLGIKGLFLKLGRRERGL